MLNEFISPVRKALSRVDTLPLLAKVSPSASKCHSQEELAGYETSQKLSFNCAIEIGKIIQPGWTEKEAAFAMETWLRDHGVKNFFHKPFVWWGSRSRFDGVRTYRDFLPTSRRLVEGEIFILDVAPIVNGYISDIGFSAVFGENLAFKDAQKFLANLREEIPNLVQELRNGAAVWCAIDMKIKAAGYENIHSKYPFGVLGHRVHKAKNRLDLSLLNFGWQSYWGFTSRGLFGQLLDAEHTGNMEGVWAIEPHIGGSDFGMKFEEILVVEGGKARWMEPATTWSMARDRKVQPTGAVS